MRREVGDVCCEAMRWEGAEDGAGVDVEDLEREDEELAHIRRQRGVSAGRLTCTLPPSSAATINLPSALISALLATSLNLVIVLSTLFVLAE